MPHHGNCASVGFEQTEDHADQSGFSASIWPDQTDIVILEHFEGNIFQNGIGFVACPKIFNRDNGFIFHLFLNSKLPGGHRQ